MLAGAMGEEGVKKRNSKCPRCGGEKMESHMDGWLDCMECRLSWVVGDYGVVQYWALGDECGPHGDGEWVVVPKFTLPVFMEKA